MKFVCDSCHAQYMISDDKVGANGVKVRCKKCSNIIVVKKVVEAEATMVMQNPLANAQATGPDALFGGVGMDEIGQAFDNVLSNSGPQQRLDSSDEATVGAGTPTQTEMPMAASGTGGELGDHESTRVMDLKSMAGLAAQSSEGGGLGEIPDAIKAQGFVDGNKAKNEVNGHANGSNGAHANGTNGAAVPQTDWYVAIDEQQQGPLTLDVVKGHWEQGKVTPDSLVWRNGYGDWKPLSAIPELVKVLTPIPAPRKAPEKKPEEQAPAGATASGPQLPASVTPAPMAVPDPDEVDWKPAAATALASLVAEEMEALAKPAPKPRAEPVGVGENTNAVLPKPLLSVEPPAAPVAETPVTMNRLISAAAAESASSAPAAKDVEQPEVIVRPPPPAAAAPSPYASVSPYPSQPEVPVYPAPAAYVPPAASSSNTKYIVIGAAVVLVCLTAVAITYLLAARPHPAQNAVAMNEPAPQPKPVEAAPQPAPQPKPAPVAAPPPTQPAAKPAAPPAAQPAAAQPAQPAAVAKVEEPPAEPPKPVANETRAQRKERYEKWKAQREAAAEAKKAQREAAKEARAQQVAAAQAEKSAKTTSSDDLLSAGGGSKVDRDFDRLLGGGGSDEAAPAPKPKKHGSDVYIPGDINSSLPKQLGQGDIMQVVAGHKSQILGCVKQQRAKDPDSSGSLTMHWVIQRGGNVTGVSVGAGEFKNSAMGHCMTGLIRGWRFPQFSGPPMPIDFPFRF